MNRSTLGLLSFIISWSLPKPMSIKSVIPSSHLILCRPLLLLPPTPPTITVFYNESVLHIRWPKYWSFSFNISPSNEHPGLISFRVDWWDRLAVQGTLQSLLQHHSSKASIQTLQARREWQDILRVMKENNLQPRLPYPARISFIYEGEFRSFTDKQELREFSTTKPALQQMLKDLL